MARRRTVVFDFDGVINPYEKGFISPTVITEAPVEGIKEEIEDLRTDHRVVVVSTRCAYEGGITAIQKYLEKYGIVVDNVQAEKPPAYAYVDDRGINFDGIAKGLANKVRGFVNWVDKKKTIKSVEQVEDSKLQKDIDAALKLVNKLPDSEEKIGLQERINIIKNELLKNKE